MKYEGFHSMAERFFGSGSAYEETVWLRLVTLFCLKLCTIFSTTIMTLVFALNDMLLAPQFLIRAAYISVTLIHLLTYRYYKSVRVFSVIFLVTETLYPILLHTLEGGFFASQGDIIWIIVAIVTVILMFSLKFAGRYFFAVLIGLAALGVIDFSLGRFGSYELGKEHFLNMLFNASGFITVVFIPISTFLPEMERVYRRLKSAKADADQANDEYMSMNQRLTESNGELEQAMARLEATLSELQSTQSRLVQSEKMASLGQLIAGIAHEINTPSGAIKASATVILTSLRENLSALITACRSLDDEEARLALHLVDTALAPSPLQTTSEVRVRKNRLLGYLNEIGVGNALSLSGLLAEMNILEKDAIVPLIPRLKAGEGMNIIDLAYQFITMARGTSNILVASEKVSKIVFALKSFSHYDHSGEPSLTDIPEGLETVLTLYYNQLKTGVRVIKNYEELPLINAWPDELNQVWINIIHNAIQAMDGSGTLSIATRRADGNIEVAFSDTGCGIPEENRAHIFKPFFTTKGRGEGSGLGLDIVRAIVEKHGGSVAFDSEVGRGTTFRITLPINGPGN